MNWGLLTLVVVILVFFLGFVLAMMPLIYRWLSEKGHLGLIIQSEPEKDRIKVSFKRLFGPSKPLYYIRELSPGEIVRVVREKKLLSPQKRPKVSQLKPHYGAYSAENNALVKIKPDLDELLEWVFASSAQRAGPMAGRKLLKRLKRLEGESTPDIIVGSSKREPSFKSLKLDDGGEEQGLRVQVVTKEADNGRRAGAARDKN